MTGPSWAEGDDLQLTLRQWHRFREDHGAEVTEWLIAERLFAESSSSGELASPSAGRRMIAAEEALGDAIVDYARRHAAIRSAPRLAKALMLKAHELLEG
ncbi:MAG: hypothetical protein NVS3B24_03870 [Candidatus Dormibacteria bacterium]